MRILLKSLVFLCLILSAATASGAEVPYLSGRVNDHAELLSAEARRTITDLLKAHEEKTGNQVVVLTIPDLEGDNIEEYAVKVFSDWKLGQKGKDNGVLVVVAPKDRRMRIEVGYGLEPELTDLLAGRIIQNVMTPRFRAGDYNGGIQAGVQAVMAVLEKGEAAVPTAGPAQKSSTRPGLGIDSAVGGMPIAERILIGAFIFGIIGLFTIVGILTPGVGWFLYLFLIPFWAAFPMAVVGTKVAIFLLGIYLIGYPIAKLLLRNKPWYQKASQDLKTKGHANLGGFTISSSGVSSGSGSGGVWSSGGGFSGGGGSSGGGGASGSW